jgi:hypothetical protein
VLAPALVKAAFPVASTVGLFFFEMFIAGGFVVFALSDGMSALPKRHSAFLAGICISAWALVTGVLMPGIGYLFDHGRYYSAFWIVACMPLLGTFLWRVLRTGPTNTQRPDSNHVASSF